MRRWKLVMVPVPTWQPDYVTDWEWGYEEVVERDADVPVREREVGGDRREREVKENSERSDIGGLIAVAVVGLVVGGVFAVATWVWGKITRTRTEAARVAEDGVDRAVAAAQEGEARGRIERDEDVGFALVGEEFDRDMVRVREKETVRLREAGEILKAWAKNVVGDRDGGIGSEEVAAQSIDDVPGLLALVEAIVKKEQVTYRSDDEKEALKMLRGVGEKIRFEDVCRLPDDEWEWPDKEVLRSSPELGKAFVMLTALLIAKDRRHQERLKAGLDGMRSEPDVDGDNDGLPTPVDSCVSSDSQARYVYQLQQGWGSGVAGRKSITWDAVEIYNVYGLNRLLHLRICNIVHNKRIEILRAKILTKELNDMEQIKILSESISMYSKEDCVLVLPLLVLRPNECVGHWVGVTIDNRLNYIKVSYLDSDLGSEDIIKTFKNNIVALLQENFNNKNVIFDITSVEKQKGNNCGSEVIENIAMILSGTRSSQDEAIYLHSSLLANDLLSHKEDRKEIQTNHEMITFYNIQSTRNQRHDLVNSELNTNSNTYDINVSSNKNKIRPCNKV